MNRSNDYSEKNMSLIASAPPYCFMTHLCMSFITLDLVHIILPHVATSRFNLLIMFTKHSPAFMAPIYKSSFYRPSPLICWKLKLFLMRQRVSHRESKSPPPNQFKPPSPQDLDFKTHTQTSTRGITLLGPNYNSIVSPLNTVCY